jgi:hypothetical protein
LVDIFKKAFQMILMSISLATCANLSYKPNWGQHVMQKGQKIEDKNAEGWGQVVWVL